MQRRHRLSRSKDFDAVYRHGTSASGRYLTLHWFPRDDDPDGAPRLGSRRSAVGRDGRRPQPGEAAAPRGMARAAWPRSRRVATTCSSRGRACRAGRGSRRRLARARDRRGAREGRAHEVPARAIGGAVYALAVDVRLLLTPPGTCKYHPSCSQYAIDALRSSGSFAGAMLAALAAPALQPVEPRWRRLRARPDALPAPSLEEEGEGVIVGGLLSPIENVLTDVLTWLHETGGLTLGVVDRRADGDRPDPARPGRAPPDPLDAEPADARAGDEGDPAALQGGPPEAERRAHEVLQGEQDQPVRGLPADRLPDPDLHLALLRPQGLREGGLQELPGVLARLARPRQHHRADEVRLGPGPARRLRREPADVDVAHVDVDAEHGAARDDHGAADRLHPLHHQISRRGS